MKWTVPNPCSFCRASCCKNYTITTTSFDVLRLHRHTGRKPAEFAVLHEARLLCYDLDLLLDFADHPRSHLLGLKSHPCVFLGKDGLCRVHASAPLSCRRYPFTTAGSMNARFCPLIPQVMFWLKGPDIPKNPILKELDAYKEIVEEWNKKSEKKNGCIPFLMKRSEEIF